MDNLPPQEPPQPPPPTQQPDAQPPGYYPPGAYPPQQQGDKTTKTVLIILGAACGCIFALVIFSIVAAIAIPAFLSARDRAVDDRARSALETIGAAEAKHYGNYGNYATLTDLYQQNLLDPSFSGDPADLGDGIIITVEVSPDGQRYAAIATGAKATYYLDDSGQIKEY